MRIQDVMSTPAVLCGRNDSLNDAARLMWEHDCGVIPVVKEDGRIAGIVTDRDICMAAYTKGKPLGSIPVAEAMAPRVFSCRVDDTLESVAQVMSDNQVHRLPVLDPEDRPVGLASFTDLVRYASTMAHGDGVERDILRGLAAVSRPRTEQSRPSFDLPAPRLAAAPSPATSRERRQARGSR